ncbi:MAG: LOG family protein [Proteobacteria bacterium]|nr:LOG family protein [Pseudomonadota bacterium]
MTASQTLTDAASYRLPVADTEFLLRDEMRGVRFALEYGKAELELRDHGIRSTVVVFGSARIPSPEQAQRLVETARTPQAADAARRATARAQYYDQARRFAHIVSRRGGALTPANGLRDNVIATGGGPGIMEAANRGAMEAGAPSVAYNIELPAEQLPNPYSTPSLCFRFHYFAMRKMHLAMRANALAVFPGGFGTLDELFEILTLQQTHKGHPIPIVLFGGAYWREVIDFEAMARHAMLDPADLGLFQFVDDPEQAWQSLVERGLVVGGRNRAPTATPGP